MSLNDLNKNKIDNFNKKEGKRNIKIAISESDEVEEKENKNENEVKVKGDVNNDDIINNTNTYKKMRNLFNNDNLKENNIRINNNKNNKIDLIKEIDMDIENSISIKSFIKKGDLLFIIYYFRSLNI